jgi:hypothetical protein
MSCPFAGRATRHTARGERVTVRVCAAVVYERDQDPSDLPLPSVCFSDAAFQQCYHFRTMIQRKEIAQRLGLIPPEAPLVDEPIPELVPFQLDSVLS